MNLCDEDEAEKETLESMKVLEPYHFVIAELVPSLEKFDFVSFRSHIGRDVADHAETSS